MKRLFIVLIFLFYSVLISNRNIAVAFFENITADPSNDIKKIFDSNHDKIFENLARMIEESLAGGELPIIVVFKESVNENRENQLRNLLGDFITKHDYKNFPLMAMTLNVGKIMVLASLDMVKHIEYDKPVTLAIDDSSYWFGVTNAKTDFTLTGNGVVVAILDSGIDPTHVDLDAGKIVGWKDFVNDLPDAYDDNGHGTACSGVIAGDGDGNIAYKGVANGADLVGVKVMPASGVTTMSTVLAGIDWCISNQAVFGIDVMNISLGSVGTSDGTDAASVAVNNAVDNGIVVVVAAGNEGPGTNTIGVPAAAEKAITVGAMADVAEQGFYLGYFSSRGPTADGRVKPDIVAPGVHITSPVANSIDQYEAYSGTSLSAPFISGVVALMLEANPGLTPSDIKNTLADTAVDWGESGKDNEYGDGRLDAYAAIASADGLSGTNIETPDVLTASDNLSGYSSEDIYEFEIDDASYPIAVTLIENSSNCFVSVLNSISYPSNVEISLLDLEGNVLKEATSITRQANISYTPSSPGTYRIKVTSKLQNLLFSQSDGSADYTFDISAGLDEGIGLTLIQDQ